ncbi:MAG: hypothetical protein ACRC20_08560 [Segniliparus sp.]|uniref:hypothetical protein n=1 Tax=Segniliparus sp. TaxID=2804064 RepID=UPI003F2F08C3
MAHNGVENVDPSVDLFALFGIADYLERKGVVERAIPLVARVLDCTVEEAALLHAKQKAPAEAWVNENAANDEQWSSERAHNTFQLLLQHMDPDEASRAVVWLENLNR